MAEESFILLSLKESKAKRLAQVISNESARKILDYLAKKDATETELSEKLDIPLSTIHYNLKHLVENRLVLIEEFHYSERGREVQHYKLANKLIIIAPKEMDESTLSKVLNSMLPLSAVVLGATAVVHFLNNGFLGFGKASMASNDLAVQGYRSAPLSEARGDIMTKTAAESAPQAVAEAGAGVATIGAEAIESAADSALMASEPVLDNIVNTTANFTSDVAVETVNEAANQLTPIMFVSPESASALMAPALWFLLGGILSTLFILIFLYVRDRKK